jgi:phosphate:Na+ symporter
VFEIVAMFLAGMGLFFVGMKILTDHLKMLSGRKLREKIAQLTTNCFQGYGYPVASG